MSPARRWATHSSQSGVYIERIALDSRRATRPPDCTPRMLLLRLKELRGPFDMALQVAHTESNGFRIWLDKPGQPDLSVRFPADEVELLLRAMQSDKPGWLTDEAIIAYACALPGATPELRTAEHLRSLNHWIQKAPLTPADMTEQDKRNMQPRS